MLFLSFLAFTALFRIPWKISATACVLSFGCSYLFFAASSLLVSAAEAVLIVRFRFYPPKPLLSLILGVLEFLGVICLFRVRRLKHGLPFLYDMKNSYTGIFLGASILTAVSFLSLNENLDFIYFILIFSIFIWGITLLLWWKERIRKKYLDRVNERAVRTLEDALTAKDTEIAELKKQNETLAKIIHKDNKLIPAMEYSVRELFRSKDAKRADELLSELKRIFQDRTGLLMDCGIPGKQLPATGLVSVDILLAYMLQKAGQEDICFEIALPGNMNSVTERIPVEDLRTILADLLENAMIAVSDCQVKKVLLTMKNQNGSYAIEIYDSGPPFSREVLANLGLRPVTTRREEGGSGIGLMTVSELCAKYSVGFAVEDLSPSSPPGYMKKVCIVI